MGNRVKLVWYKKNWYHPNFFKRGPRCIEKAKYTCQHCGKKRGEQCIAKSGRLSKVVIQAAHANHDPENGRAVLIALCKQCHMRYDGLMHGTKAKRTHYRKITEGQIEAGQMLLFALQSPAISKIPEEEKARAILNKAHKDLMQLIYKQSS